jgi:hypothetical protein
VGCWSRECFFGLNNIKSNKFLSCTRLGKYIQSHWVDNDNMSYGANSIFGEHNVNSTRRVECSWKKHMKPTSHAMATKMSQIASWVLICSLPWTQHKRWIPIRSMGCVHTHQGYLQLKDVLLQVVVETLWKKTRKNNQNVKKTSWVVNQMFAPRPEHDKFGHNGLKIFCQRAC